MALSGSVFSEENFRRMAENALIGILFIDREMTWRFVFSRKAVEKLNGEIIATSAPGEGSDFSIFLPKN